MRKLLFFLWFLTDTLSVLAQLDSNLIVLRHANVINGVSNKPLLDITVTVEYGKITKLEKHGPTPPNATVINLKGTWLLPGFIDAHVHLVSFETARRALSFGVTTTRSMQCDHFIDLAIRDAHQRGQADLPDVIAAGYQIRPDMSDAFYEDFPELSDLKPRVTGVDNVRRVVRALLSRKVDHIKILATERAGTPDSDPKKRTFSDEEFFAIVDEARKSGLFVAAHAYSDDGAAAAVQAGVRSIEHGSFLSDKTLTMMKSKGTYFDPGFTFWTEAATKPIYKENPILAERLRTIPLYGKAVTKRAFKMGIPIVAGTDITYTTPGISLFNEAIQLEAAGLPVMEIIKAMTSRSARCLNIDRHTGSIKKGLDADIVIIRRNPLEDISALQDIMMIINDGKIVVNKLP